MTDNKHVKYDYPSSCSGGVKPLSIRGLFEDPMQRVSEDFTDSDRMWRKQWLRDQLLSDSEPRHVPELEKELQNPIRRLASKPWSYLQSKMIPICGASFAATFRYCAPKLLVSMLAFYMSYYHLKYNQNDWTQKYGWRVQYCRPAIYPGDPRFPAKRDRTRPQDYNDRGFSQRTVFLD